MYPFFSIDQTFPYPLKSLVLERPQSRKNIGSQDTLREEKIRKISFSGERDLDMMNL